MASETDSDRVARYAEAYFQRHHKEEWVTIRRAAKSLGWTQDRVVDAIEGDPENRTFTSSYFGGDDPPIGEHFIETWGPDVE